MALQDIHLHYGSVLDGSARTNNLSEGWHNRFDDVVGKQHPSLYACFDEIKKEQADTEVMFLIQLQIGQWIRKAPSRKQKEREANIYAAVQQYQQHVDLQALGNKVKF